MGSSDGRFSFQKIINFRDVGQHINHLAGQSILRPGLLFRGARPDGATSQDRQRLVTEFNIKTILDLRTPTEHIEQNKKRAADIPSAPAIKPSDPAAPLRIAEIKYRDVNFNGSGYSNALIKQLSYGHRAKLYGLYVFGYRKEAISVLGSNVMAERGLDGLAEDSLAHSQAEVKEVFSVLCDASTYPLMLHCTQGKDRTGLTILLALLVCGVPSEAIQKDYQLSESELKPERDEKVAELRSIGLPDAFADCPPDWAANVSSYLDRVYGGVEKYLEKCGVTVEQQATLRRLLTTA